MHIHIKSFETCIQMNAHCAQAHVCAPNMKSEIPCAHASPHPTPMHMDMKATQ